jgi:ABC-type multidrug transport system ATPase subunit
LTDDRPRRTVLLASRFPAREVGICSHVALLRHGRLALLAPISDLEREGLSLSMRGIETLADRREPAAATRAG